MKRRMQPRAPKERPPMSVKARGDLDCRRAAAINEVVVKQNTDIVDQIRRLGKGSTNMLMRVTMMDDRPIFAGDAEELPSSLTRGKALPVEPATRSSEDLVRGGKGDKLFLVSRGVTPGVIPARYNQTGVTTSSASYVNHNTNLVMARSQGHAQHKDWEQAAKRKAELERNLEMIDREINSEYDEVKDSATGHGMFGRQSKADPLDLATGGNEMAMSFNFGDKVLGGSNAHHSKDVRDLTAPLKGLTAKKESTMKDSFIEHSYGLRMANAKGCKKTPIPIDKFRYSLLAPEGIDEKEIDISKSGLKTYARTTASFGKFTDVKVPHDPTLLTIKAGSGVVGGAFRWRGTHERSKNASDYSMPDHKLEDWNDDTNSIAYKHRFGNYAITKTRYGVGAKECDLGNVYVTSLADKEKEELLRMKG